MDDNRHPEGNILKQMVDSLGPWQIPLAICSSAVLFFHGVSAKMKPQLRIQATERREKKTRPDFLWAKELDSRHTVIGIAP